jgi:transposase
MEVGQQMAGRRIVGGVDTHKDLHVAAVVDELDRVLVSQCFATIRRGYKQMLTWMRAFGSLQRIGVEATGTYGAGCCVTCRTPALRSWRSPHRIHMIAVSVVRTMISMPKMPRTPPSPASGPSRPNAATA